MNSSPPPIRPQSPQGFPKQPPGIPSSSGPGNMLIILSGVGLLLIALFELFRIGYDLVNVMDIIQYVGPEYFGEYFLYSHYQFFLLAFFGIGGIGLLVKKKWGWSFGIAATGFTVLLFLYFLGSSLFLGYPLGMGGGPRFVVLILTTLISIAVFVMLILPDLRKALQVGATEFGIGAGVLGFLVLDFVAIAFLL